MIEEKTPNWETAVYALYLLGGATKSVHTEDIALRCFELSPGSFSWIRHVDLPDKEVTRSSLMDARKDKYGRLVTGRAGRHQGQYRGRGIPPEADGWSLSEAGVKWVQENQDRVQRSLGTGVDQSNRQEISRALRRVTQSAIFQDFMNDREGFVPKLGDLAELLRCRVDADSHVWSKRFAMLRNQARLAHQGDVLDFLEKCETLRVILAQ